MKGSKSSYKYSKITPQKKFHLLNLVLREKMLIKEAAKIVGINYSTAKTILFFNRNGDRSYQFQLPIQEKVKIQGDKAYATFRDKSFKQDTKKEHLAFDQSLGLIEVISTIGSRYAFQICGNEPKEAFSDPMNDDHQIYKLNKGEQKMRIFKKEVESNEQIKASMARPLTRSRASRVLTQKTCKIEQMEQVEITVKKQED